MTVISSTKVELNYKENQTPLQNDPIQEKHTNIASSTINSSKKAFNVTLSQEIIPISNVNILDSKSLCKFVQEKIDKYQSQNQDVCKEASKEVFQEIKRQLVFNQSAFFSFASPDDPLSEWNIVWTNLWQIIEEKLNNEFSFGEETSQICTEVLYNLTVYFLQKARSKAEIFFILRKIGMIMSKLDALDAGPDLLQKVPALHLLLSSECNENILSHCISILLEEQDIREVNSILSELISIFCVKKSKYKNESFYLLLRTNIIAQCIKSLGVRFMMEDHALSIFGASTKVQKTFLYLIKNQTIWVPKRIMYLLEQGFTVLLSDIKSYVNTYEIQDIRKKITNNIKIIKDTNSSINDITIKAISCNDHRKKYSGMKASFRTRFWAAKKCCPNICNGSKLPVFQKKQLKDATSCSEF